MENALISVLLITFILGGFLYTYYTWQAYSYFKENYPLAFLNFFNLLLKDKFKPEGNKYRIRALITLFAMILIMIFMFNLGKQ